MKAKFSLLFLLAAFAASTQLAAQATLSVQGTLQKSFGSAVDDGEYSLTFKIYVVETGGTPIWSETQDGVEIVNGVYSVLLGTVEPLTVPFDEVYFVGVAVDGGAELIPRTQLTSSPYALSLIGTGNIFPSTGAIGAGTTAPTAGYELHAKDAAGDAKVLVEGSDNAKIVVDGGTGSEIEFVNGSDTASITFDGTNITVENLNIDLSNGVNLPAGASVSYNGIADWRLVDFDDFESTTEGWAHYTSIFPNANTAAATLFAYNGGVNTGKACGIAENQSGWSVLKKQIDLTGIPHTMVKVVFVLHFTGSPDSEWYAGGFEPTLTSAADAIEWAYIRNYTGSYGIQGVSFDPFSTRNARFSDQVQMTTSHSGNSLVVLMGGQLDENTTNESFTIDNVEIYVR